MHAYDAARILISALRSDPTASNLPAAIKQVAPFDGLVSTITFDAFGDVERSLFPIEVREGAFRDL